MKYAAYYISILSLILALALSSTFLGLESAWANSVTKTISFDSNPVGVAFNSINGKIYVTSQNPGTTSVIDTATNIVEDSIPLGGQAIVFNSANNRLYITSLQGTSSPVFVVDPSTNNILHSIFVGNDPCGIAVNAADNKIYVSNLHSDTVSVIDGVTDSVVKTISVGHLPFGVAFNPVNGNVYVANQGSDTISVIDSSNDDIIQTITLGDGTQPRALDVNPSNGHIYVANIAADTLSEIDGQTNNALSSIPVGSPFEGQGPIAVAFNTLNNKVYVANYKTDNVAIIDTSIGKVIESIPVDPDPEAIAFNPNNGNMYTANFLSKTVSVISTTGFISPRNTAITSATDGNGNPVQNSGSTVSTSITFQVSATPGSNPIAGFECSLDASQFSTCATNTNPGIVSYNSLAAGQQHTFKVRAVDTLGNKDPAPATFTWTILTPPQAIQNIINTIDNMHLSHSTSTSLEAPLNNAIKQLNRNNDVAACSALDAFLHQVKAKEDNGQLTSQQAANLRQQATAIETSLGCSSASTIMTAATNNNDQDSTFASSVIEKQREQALTNLRNISALSSMTK